MLRILSESLLITLNESDSAGMRAIADQADRDALPSTWACIEALLALSTDASLDALKAQIAAAKAAGVVL